MFNKVYLACLLVALTVGSACAAEYALYAPTPGQGGQVGSDGTWEISDPCRASQSFQE